MSLHSSSKLFIDFSQFIPNSIPNRRKNLLLLMKNDLRKGVSKLSTECDIVRIRFI